MCISINRMRIHTISPAHFRTANTCNTHLRGQCLRQTFLRCTDNNFSDANASVSFPVSSDLSLQTMSQSSPHVFHEDALNRMVCVVGTSKLMLHTVPPRRNVLVLVRACVCETYFLNTIYMYIRNFLYERKEAGVHTGQRSQQQEVSIFLRA